MVVILQAALAKAWGRGFSLDNLTLDNLTFVMFENNLTRGATINTFVYAGAASIIAIVLALCISYAVNRQLVGKRANDLERSRRSRRWRHGSNNP
jgi:iron(III) transport system permease protein